MPEEAFFFPAARRKLIRHNKLIQYESIDGASTVGGLLSLDEFVFEKAASVRFSEPEDRLIHLLPLVGTLRAEASNYNLSIQPGQSALLPVTAGDTVVLSNTEADEITFIRVVIKKKLRSELEVSEVELDAHPDRLLVPHVVPTIRLGQFGGRRDTTLGVHPGNMIFFFVIEGAFEVQGRLLERRDGLSLQNVREVEFESLSDYAIVWMIEI